MRKTMPMGMQDPLA